MNKKIKESNIMKQIQVVLASIGVKVFRNNVGVLKDKNGKYVRFGLVPGSSDLIGWKTIEIRDEHLGQQLAVFVALEIKTDKGKLSAEQLNFLNSVHRAGGIANVCRSTSEALDTLTTSHL